LISIEGSANVAPERALLVFLYLGLDHDATVVLAIDFGLFLVLVVVRTDACGGLSRMPAGTALAAIRALSGARPG
jgi:hypothetical protein